MEKFTGFVKELGGGGFGSEAKVTIELRTEIPGLGGTIITNQAIITAKRENHDQAVGSGIRGFLRHAVIKKLDDYFQKSGRYRVSHVTRPIGSLEAPREGYLYEWAHGSENFPWFYIDTEYNKRLILLDEWSEFVGSFDAAGIGMDTDCCDPDNAELSKNIIHKMSVSGRNDEALNCLWSRIDFGNGSLMVDFDKLRRYIAAHRQDMLDKLGMERYELIGLAIKLLSHDCKISAQELGKLELLSRLYRLSALRHFVARVSDADARFRILP